MRAVSYKLNELCRVAGVTPRTVRFYIKEGLLPPPVGPKSFSRYGYEHWLRLALIRRFKEKYLPLREIKNRLDGKTFEQLEALARQEEVELPDGDRSDITLPPTMVLPFPTQKSPTSLTPVMRSEHPSRSFSRPLGFRAPGNYDMEEADYFEAEKWERITLAPGYELHVSGSVADSQRGKIGIIVEEVRRLLGDK
jgi:DNA-binding transcriptional MerR regulator